MEALSSIFPDHYDFSFVSQGDVHPDDYHMLTSAVRGHQRIPVFTGDTNKLQDELIEKELSRYTF